LTRPLGKQAKQTPDKGNGDIEDLQRMVKKLSNEIIDMKRNAGEVNQGQRPYKPFFKRNPPFKAIEPPPANLNIDLGNVAYDCLCTYHQENHYERDCPQWVHAMDLMANQFLDKVSLTEQPSGLVVNITDQEEIDPPQDTTMLIWDLALIILSDDLFESQEQPVEVSIAQTRSKGPHVLKDTAATQISRSKTTSDHLKAPFSPSKNPISIHTRESPKLDYNVVEYLKKLKANISIMDICKIPQQKDFLLQALKSVENPTTSNGQEINLSPTDLVIKPTVNTCSEDRKEKPFVLPFLLTFEVFNKSLHNCLVDLGASFNVMPLSICKKLNAVLLKSDKHVIQLDRTQVKVMGELKDVMIRIATHPKFVQVIDIIVVDIPEAYGLLLRRDRSEKLNRYFSIDWAHLWLPRKGYKNMIRIDRERYLKHTVIDLETLNEPSSTDFFVLGNYSCDSYFGNFYPLLSDVPLTQNHEMVFQEKLLILIEETLFCQEHVLDNSELAEGKEESNREREVDTPCPQCWTLLFDGSKSQEVLGVGCILIDPKGKHHFLSYRLEFECTNNTAEYESLVQGLKKAIDLNVKELKVFKDSEIIIRQVRNTIHCNSPHLKNYQQEVHRLIEHFEAFNITAIPRVKNILAYSMATTASRLPPPEDYQAS
jgi:ribonuclease HI